MDTVNEMETGNGTVGATLPAWMAEEPSEALRELYVKLPDKMGRQLEDARQSARKGFANYVLLAWELFAGYRDKDNPDVSFKDWCRINGISYNTANSIRQREQKRREQASNSAIDNRSVASNGRNLVLKFVDDARREQLRSLLRAVLGDASDDWVKAVEKMGEFWLAHHGEQAAA